MTPRAPVPHVCPGTELGGMRPRGPASWPGRLLERVLAPFAGVLALAGVLAALVASRLNMPGVIVETSTRPGPGELVTSPGATYFAVGVTERGDTAVPVTVVSLGDFVDKFGDRVAYGNLYDSLAAYFAEGGSRAIVTRIVGAAATVGTLTLVDRAGAPVNTLRIDALSAGAWSSRVKIQVADSALADRFTISVLLDDVVVEVFANLATPAEAVLALDASSYVRATNLASATAAPANNPAVLAATVLSTGTDDRAALVAADYTNALARFGPELGAGLVAIPGQTAANVGAGLIAHAKAHARLALLAPAAAQTPTQAKATAVGFLLTAGSEHAGLAYPHVILDDARDGRRTVSPEGYIAGARARAHRTEGPWRAPAGQISRANFVVDVERTLTRDEISDLNANNVIPVAVIAGAVTVYGWRSLSADSVNYRLLTGRDVMNEVAAEGARRLEAFVFGTVDPRGHYLGQLETEMHAVLEPMLTAGGLFEKVDAATGDVISPAYRIDTGPAVNTEAVLAADEVRVDVQLRVSPTGELIRLRLTKVAFDSNI